jgi:hypothetical protein
MMNTWHHLALVLGQVGAIAAYIQLADGVDYRTDAEVARIDVGLTCGFLDDSWERRHAAAQRRAARRNGIND